MKNARSSHATKTSGFLMAAAVFAADQLTKWAALDLLRLPEGAIEVTPFFNLAMVWNTGVSFGMLAGGGDAGRWLLIGVTALVTSALLVWLWRNPAPRVAWALGLVIGGALGNLIDRIRFGAVADFLDFHLAGWHWPAFNIADAAIVIGVAILAWDGIFGGTKEAP